MFALLHNLTGTNKCMGADNPVMFYSGNLVPLKPTIKFKEVSVSSDSDGVSGLIMKGLRITCLAFATGGGKHAGQMCNHQGMNREGKSEAGCACISAQSCIPPPIIVIKLKIITPSNESFIIENYSSLHFTQMCVFKNGIPQGLRANALMDWELKDSVVSAMSHCFKEVN